MRTNDTVVGRKQIAAALKCSEKAISRLYAAGKLRGAFKLGGTSPLKIGRVEVARVKSGKA